MQHECRDCLVDPPARPRKLATVPGEPKRCATHLRAFKAARRRTRRASHVERTYDISAKDAGELLVFQGGRCWICGKADGTTKALAVDHDHSDGWPRGRACGVCNQFIGQRLGDDPAKAQRLVEYLSGDTPYRRMLAERWIRAERPGTEPAHIRLFVDGNDVWVRFAARGHRPNWRTTLDELQAYATPKGER